MEIIFYFIPPIDFFILFVFFGIETISSIACGGLLLSPNNRRFRIGLGIILNLCGVFLPWRLSHPFVRAFFTITGLIYIIRNSQMFLDPEACGRWSITKRLYHTFWHFDHRLAIEGPRAFSWSFFSLWFFNNICAAIILYIRSYFAQHYFFSSIFSCFSFFFILSGFDAFLQWFSLITVGYRYKTSLMNSPWKAGSLRQFWGFRWNSVIQKILAGIFYKPFEKSVPGPLLVLLTFGGSGCLHIYPLYIAGLNAASLFSHFSFFVCQALLVIFEFAFLPKLNHPLWTWFWLCITCPLFVHPVTEFNWI